MNQVTEKKNNVPQKFNLEEHANEGGEFITARDTKLPILKYFILIHQFSMRVMVSLMRKQDKVIFIMKSLVAYIKVKKVC